VSAGSTDLEVGETFPDPRLVAAIVDRVTFNAHILETGTKSHRLATGRTSDAAGQLEAKALFQASGGYARRSRLRIQYSSMAATRSGR
jgi:hypothetical protein